MLISFLSLSLPLSLSLFMCVVCGYYACKEIKMPTKIVGFFKKAILCFSLSLPFSLSLFMCVVCGCVCKETERSTFSWDFLKMLISISLYLYIFLFMCVVCGCVCKETERPTFSLNFLKMLILISLFFLYLFLSVSLFLYVCSVWVCMFSLGCIGVCIETDRTYILCLAVSLYIMWYMCE